MNATKEVFQTLNNKEISKITLKNKDMTVSLLSYGATVHELIFKGTDVAVGFKTAEEYKKSTTYAGAVVGRYANRIGNGEGYIDKKLYKFSKNDNGVNHLHGGNEGYKDVNWEVKELKDGDEPSVTFYHIDKDGHENYPGTVKISVTYTLTKDNGLHIHYYATTDKTTIINPTNHTYFNLNGDDSGDATGHEIFINADYYTPINENLIPTGEIKNVSGTPFDFRVKKAIKTDINAEDQDLEFAGGYDHNFVLNTSTLDKPCVTVTGEKSGISMDVYTNLFGIQFYSGNFMSNEEFHKSGKPHEKRGAFCLETQFFPDSPNKPIFPSCEVTPDEEYESDTIYKFYN